MQSPFALLFRLKSSVLPAIEPVNSEVIQSSLKHQYNHPLPKPNLSADYWQPNHTLIARANERVHRHAAQTQQVGTYGTDAFTREAKSAIKDLLGGNADIFITPTGTAANLAAMRACREVMGRGQVLLSERSHMHELEGGVLKQADITPHVIGPAEQLPGGRLSMQGILRKLPKTETKRFSNTFQEPVNVVSLDHPTSDGAGYLPEMIRNVVERAHQSNALVHVDGTRFLHLAQASGVSPASLMEQGVDLVTISPSKLAGVPGAEILAINQRPSSTLPLSNPSAMNLGKVRTKLSKALAGSSGSRGSASILKEMGATQNNTAIQGAMLGELFSGARWRLYAQNAIEMRQRLEKGISQVLQKEKAGNLVSIPFKSDVNHVYLRFPEGELGKSLIQSLSKRVAFSQVGAETDVRLITSYATAPEDVDRAVIGLQDSLREHLPKKLTTLAG